MTVPARTVSRPPKTCPKCRGVARPAYYRGERPPGGHAAFVPIVGRYYCPSCEKLVESS